MPKLQRHCLFISSFFLITACATATRGTHEMVRVNSVPEGASAISNLKAPRLQTFQDGTMSPFYGCAPTPCGINLPRKSDPVVEVSKDGHESIKFKIVSTWETASASVPPGAIVSGTPRKSHVIAGKPDALKRIPIQGASITGGLVTLGAGSVLDYASGANLSLSPNPVTVKLVETGATFSPPEDVEETPP